MDATNDQISTNKPPLLPKPCLNPSSSEPTDHVIPQMVITSADDEAKEIQIASEALPISNVSNVETTADIQVKDLRDTNLPPESTPDQQKDNGVQIGDTNFSIAQSQSMPQEHTEIKPEEPASHSAIQRPLIIESEKCASQRSITEPNVQISESPISPPSVPLTAMQRPLVFDGSSQMTEGFVLASEGTLEMCSSEISPVQRENLERDARIEDEEIKNGDAKISTVDIKPKSSGFSWMPSFSKQHSTGKDEKSAEIHTNKEPESKENKKIKDAEPHIKKDGMKKFFDNLLHDTSTDTKNKPIIQDDHHDSEDVGVKRAKKDTNKGVTKLFTPSKQDTESKGKISVTTSELPKEGDSAIKETSKESRFNMKKMFDSLKHDTTEKKDTVLGSSQSETKSKGKISPTPQELPKEAEKVSKDVSKDSKFNMKSMLDSFKHDTADKKVVALDLSPSETNSKGITSTLNEPSKDVAAKVTSKDSKFTVKKMFDSFKHETPEKKDVASDLSQVETKPKEKLSSSPKEAEIVPKDSKFNMKKMFDSFKHDNAENRNVTSETAVESKIEVKVTPCAEGDAQSKDSKFTMKKMFDSFKHDSSEKKPDISVDAKSKEKNLSSSTSPKEIESSSKDSKSNISKMFGSFKQDPSEKKHIPLDSSQTEENINTSKMHKDSKSGLKKFLDSFKHDETSSDGITAIKTLETADYSKENTSKAAISKKDHSNKEMSIPEVTITSSPIEKDDFESKIPVKVSESSESAKTKPKEGSFKKFFHSFKTDAAIASKENKEKHHVKFLERDSLKRSHSFRDSILLKDEILSEQEDSNVKESFHNIRKHFGSSDKKKSNKIKRSESCKETAKEKEGFHGIRGFFDSITHKSPTKSSQTTKINDEEHIYDTVGKPESSSILKQTSSKTTDPKQKDDPSSMKKLLDSFRHKDSKPKVLKETKKDEKESDKVDSAVPSISKLVKSANEEKKIFIKKDLTKESQQPENLEAPKQKDVPKITLNLSPKFTKEKNEETSLPSIQINESPAPSKSKTSMFSSISDNFTAIKDKVIHSKDEKKEETLDQNKISEEYDLQNAAIKNQFPDSSVGSYKPIDDISFINVSLKPEDENVQHKNTNITISDKNVSSLSKPSQQSNQQPVISDKKNVLKPSSIPRPRVEPETPETLYDTCCMRLATLLGKKALEIVSEKTKAPPKKPPKPSAEAIARARAAVVSQRLRGLQSKNQSIGEGIPVGYDGIRFADEETESSCDYKDVENFDYILDYELVNRFKCDSKLDTFTDPSTCSGMSSYYTPDTVTLKDENFSDAPLETINLDNNDSNLFQHLSSPQNQTDFHSLPSKVKSKDEREKLKSLAKAGQSISSTTLTPIKKVPPPLPPKPNILPKSKDTQNKSSMSQCINGLSLSPRLQPKFAKDSAVTKKRPLMVAGLKGTEFTSLQMKSKNHSKERTFNAILKNESLKNVSTISPLHKPLQGTKSSPHLSQSCVISESSTSKKQSPKRPPPPISSIHTEEKKSKTAPPVPEKPKREGRTASTSAVIEKRTVSPPRPPPPVITKIHAAPPRPPPPSLLTSKSVNESSNQSIENQVEIIIQEPLPKLDESSSPTKLLVTESFIPEIDSKQTKIICSENSAKERDEIIVEDIPQDILNESSINFKKENEISEKSVHERSESRTPDFIFVKTDAEMVEIAPKPPPRGRRIRSRTVEIPPKQKSPESTLRRSQSLSDADVKIKTSHLTISPTTTKADLKHLYTSVNKDGKKTVVDGSQSPNVSSRPLPAPPPPPRKFRSLDRKPKSPKKKVGEEVLETNKNDSLLFQNSSNDSSIKPPERKRKGDKQRFFSLSTERKRTSSEFETQSLRMPRSYSVPLKPDRKFKHSHPEYDENANIAFPTVAEIHHSAALLDECGNEITEASSSANIPDAVDLPANGNHIEKINPHPRQKKEKNPKKSHSNWYDKSVSGDEPWELLNWDSSGTTEREFKNFEAIAEKSKMRRRSDPVVSRKIRQTSKFYVDVEIGNEGLPLVDKETSPLHLDCSEKSVQTSLETLSQGIISHDEQSELAEESSDTDNLLKIVKTLQSELKSTLNRHKSLDDDDNDTSNAATDSEKMDDRKKYLKTPSIQSSASEIWPISSSDESEAEISSGRAENLSEIALNRKKNKIFFIAREILTSEEIFVDTLKLLNVDFKAAVEAASKQRGSPVVPDEILSQILNHLPQLQQLNENLLMELKDRIDNWDKTGKIADIIVKIGPFLKLYSWYIHDFESNVALLEDAKKKYPAFAQVVKEFEASTRCKRLFLNHFMLKPIQRIPQYRLLLQEYLHHLSEDSLDYQDTITALQIVSEVADHANNSMKQGDNAQKLISIQNSIMGHKEIIKPGRLFVKEGELMKLSRKGMQPRWFVLFNDLLLYLTPVQHGLFRINHELPLSGMKVAIPIQQDYQNEFSIISVTRSFTLAARSQEERQEWIVALTKAIEENLSRRSTFTNIRFQRKMQDKNSEDDEGEFVLGKKAPVWIPDARVTMCQLCTSEFTVTFRRHHCRACGKVVCSICSSNRIPLAYLGSSKVNRVCDECYSKLGHETASTPENVETDSDNQQIAIKPHLRTEHRYVKKGKRNLPSVLKEVCANDQGSTISGYLQKRIGKSWKKEWFVVKDKVLYEYKASEDVAALSSTPLLGYNIEAFSEAYENVDMSLLFQLTHPGQAPTIFHTDSTYSTERWIAALKEASVLE